jgi:CubicO group peptidase (beta-lactamase class C family)
MMLAAGAMALPFRTSPVFGLEAGPKPTEIELAAMDEMAKRFMEEHHVPGMSVALACHGQIVYQKGFGFADTAAGEKVTPSHLFRIASVSKPVTSVAIFSLIEQGRLKLDDFVFGSKGVLKFDYGESCPDLAQKITIFHLLTHTCGGWQNDNSDPMFRHREMDHKELIASTLREQPLKNEPGQRYAYSNFGYCILGRVVEKLSGQSYAEYVRGNVLAKCGVDAMRLAGNTLENRAKGEVVYYGQDGENPYTMNVARMDSHGGWLGSPTDLVRFAMHVDGFDTTPNILSAPSVKTMTTGSPASAQYACGWSVNSAPNWWHGGSLPGTTTLLVRTASGLCWAAFLNTRANGTGAGIDRLMWKMAQAVPAWHA